MILATNMKKENPTLTTSILRDFETKLIPE